MLKLIRVPHDDPHRCTGPRKGDDGRCPFQAIFNEETGEWTKNCPRHAGVIELHYQNKANTELYLANKWEQRIKRFQHHPQSKSLTAELAVLRMLLNEKLEAYQSEGELLMASGSISELILKIQTLVKTINNIDKQNGLLMDREQIGRLADSFVKIVCNYIDDSDILEAIVDDVEKALVDVATPANIPRTLSERAEENVD